MKKCPFCAEMIQEDAVICRFCNRGVTVPAGVDARAVLQGALAPALQQLGSGWEIEAQTDTAIVFRRPGRKPNHALHFILTLLTAGFWLLVWLFVAFAGKKVDQRMVLNVDPAGELSWTPQEL